MKIETLLANLALNSDFKDPYGASHFPIYNTATFDLKKQEGNERIYDYSRSDNPTRNALENIFAKAENGFGCVCTNTGIAAISVLFETVLKNGDTVLVENDSYGGTYRLLKVLTEKNNIKTIYTDFTNLNLVEEELKNNEISLILCESPTNPSLKIIDLEEIGKLSKKYNTLFAVDNSMATFVSQKPLDLGADFSVFSTTKFISGHGSVTAGAVVSKTKELHQKVRFYANAYGNAQSPMDVYLTSLGLPTLVYRMKAQEESALIIAKFLKNFPQIKSVKFPALEDFEQYGLAKKQMSIIPAVLTIQFQDEETANQLINNTKLFEKKVSYGTSDSRLEIPAKMSHATNSKDSLASKGIDNATVRISVGLENTEDLIEDLSQALQ
ncbi:trans-sulfuration enzyme family protein [Cloacibacterium normanense]|uniref:cysteine-S-conjugate beta-lyase n=1 Tax=Cloacibacterium normanense TaxID=237258 RepID=A0A1E5UB30_9FLAO|nr:PLP-dependent aspartate aminotransferase family protein [Cloacibacterium normanense]AZI70072.1 PLP-dependent transferase [Cloacibacterium normanense]OEL10143.1 glycine cleavage system P-family protein [Cloacibacterium normanense]SDO24162.1 cystathionine beta-lyase [Cloacibacterium normanense]